MVEESKRRLRCSSIFDFQSSIFNLPPQNGAAFYDRVRYAHPELSLSYQREWNESLCQPR